MSAGYRASRSLDAILRASAEIEAEVLAVLESGGAYAIGDVASALPARPYRAVQSALGRMVKKTIVFMAGEKPWCRYALTLDRATAAAIEAARPKPPKPRAPRVRPSRAKPKPVEVPPPRASETRLRVFSLDPPAGRETISVELTGGVARLPVLRADKLTSGEQIFWCAPFATSLLAHACVGRQKRGSSAMGWTQRRAEGGGGRGSPVSPITYARCVGCPVGAIVKERTT